MMGRMIALIPVGALRRVALPLGVAVAWAAFLAAPRHGVGAQRESSTFGAFRSRLDHRVCVQTGTVQVGWGGIPLRSNDVVRVLYRPRGQNTWHEIGRAPATLHALDWVVNEPSGVGDIRCEITGTRIASPCKRVRVVPGIKDIASADSYVAALMTDGTIRAWGSFGSADLPPDLAYWRRPRPLDGVRDIVAIGAGGMQAYFVRADGKVLRWGDPDGAGPRPFKWSPTEVAGVDGAVFVRTEFGIALARLADGRVLAWGNDGGDCLIGPSNGPCDAPTEIPELRDVVDIALGRFCGIALRPDGTVLAWGANHLYQLGVADVDVRLTPAPVPGVAGAVAIAARYGRALALRGDGAVIAWGQVFNQVIGAPLDEIRQLPADVGGVQHIRAIGCNDFDACALREDGAVLTWGANYGGGLGDGTFTGSTTPVTALVPHADRIFAGYGAVHAVTADGGLLGWGDYSSVGDGGSRDRPVPVRVRIR